ncbi:protein LAS1-like isoform X2 [Mangifera indica]|uniref:protein LAS1-like isoform X2 n=1 Tax=Mangifera indica TaxID=29780 RepID=UPI001CF9C7FE|nr:protein LAS1-like isoform X2 [Mangifera indica]
MLGFEEHMMTVDDENLSSSSSNSYKLVPWLSWDEWDFIRESLFSSSADKVASAVNRISTWKSRGCLPVVIDVTASIIEIQQRDPYYRDKEEQSPDVLKSEQLLAMLYCMSILRLVNCVVEKTRRKSEFSIAEAAAAIGIPRKLIDVRHEGSHRDLPALQVVRDCSNKALDWLKAYYWEPQKKQIPFQRDTTADMRRDIKSKFQELAFCLKSKENSQVGSSLVKVKRGKFSERLCGRNKFVSVVVGKLHSSKSGGYKKKVTRCLKTLVQLYSSFSSEMVSVLLELLLNALDSLNLEFQNNSHAGQNMHMAFNDWKPVLIRFLHKEPELLLTLLHTVLNMIGNEGAKKYESGQQNQTSSEYRTETHREEHLSYLFAWLVGLLRRLKPLQGTDTAAEVKVSALGKNMSNGVQMKLLQKCLLVAPGNEKLMDSALQLAKLLGNTKLLDKLNKLSTIYSPHIGFNEENSSDLSSKKLVLQHEDFIHQAAKKLELVKRHRMQSKVVNTGDCKAETLNRWAVAKSWNPCPIGMLPQDLGSSGYLPSLDCYNNKQSEPDLSERKERWDLSQCSSKRESSINIQMLDNSSVKKMKATVEDCEMNNEEASSFEGVKGHLMIGGVWKKVGEVELRSIESGIRILV